MEDSKMKKMWQAPEISELDINETAHNWTGIYHDGGYIGDGVISGHLSWDKPTEGSNNSNNSDSLS